MKTIKFTGTIIGFIFCIIATIIGVILAIPIALLFWVGAEIMVFCDNSEPEPAVKYEPDNRPWSERFGRG